jgi:hypothetical protein
VARHQNGFSTTDGSRYPGTPSATGNVAIHPHKRICTVKADNGVDVNNEGQMIGYLQFFGSRMSPEYKLEPGEIGYLLVQRDGLGGPGARYSTLWLHGADGERLAAWPYSVCHPTKSHGSSPNAVFGWLTTETRKDCVATDTARFATWFREHHDYYHHDHDPDPLRDLKGLKKHELHNEQPWFACQEGCCHIVE